MILGPSISIDFACYILLITSLNDVSDCQSWCRQLSSHPQHELPFVHTPAPALHPHQLRLQPSGVLYYILNR